MLIRNHIIARPDGACLQNRKYASLCTNGVGESDSGGGWV